MAELTISSDEIRSAIESYTQSYTPETSIEEVGVVTDTSDGIAHVSGLPSAMANELLEFPGGVLGVALNLEDTEIGAVILGEFASIEEGQQVRRTGDVLSVPVGDKFLGRVVNPLAHMVWRFDSPRRDQVRASQRAISAIDRLFEAAGATALQTETALQRFWCDAHAGRVHAANDAERAYVMFGNQEFGLPLGDTMV